jgi:hypothetical protein
MNRAFVIIAIGLVLLAIATEAMIQSFTARTTTAKFYAMGIEDAPAHIPADNH